jgi:hypothetical protein
VIPGAAEWLWDRCSSSPLLQSGADSSSYCALSLWVHRHERQVFRMRLLLQVSWRAKLPMWPARLAL